MRYTMVESIPKSRKTNNDLENFFMAFLNKKIPFAKVLYAPHEYSSVKSAYNTLYKSARLRKLPIIVRMRNSEIYLINNELCNEKGESLL